MLPSRSVSAALAALLAFGCLDQNTGAGPSPSPSPYLYVPLDTLPVGLRPVINIQCPRYAHYDVRPLTLWLTSDVRATDTIQVTVLGRPAADTALCTVQGQGFGQSALQPVFDTAFYKPDSVLRIAVHAPRAGRSALRLAHDGAPFRTIDIQMASRQFAALAIGHRGAGWHWPESTLLALRAALRARLLASELDVRLSLDTVAVIMHDSTVDRTTNGTGRVSQLSSSYITSLDAGVKFDPRFAGEHVPTLQAVLRQTDSAQHFIYLDIAWQTRFPQDFEAALIVSLIQQAHAANRVSLMSPDTAFLKGARKLSGSIQLTFEPDAFEPWHRAFCIRNHINAIEYYATLLSDPNHWTEYWAMEQAGVRLVASTTNSPTWADSLLSHLPLSGIITDLPPGIFQLARSIDPLTIP